MKAEETILSEEQIFEIGKRFNKNFSLIDFCELPEFLVAQAEITLQACRDKPGKMAFLLEEEV